MRLSLDKVKAVVRHFAVTPADFHLAAFNDGRVVGAIAACVSEMLFFERCEARCSCAKRAVALLALAGTW